MSLKHRIFHCHKCKNIRAKNMTFEIMTFICFPKYPLQQASKFHNQKRHDPHEQTNGKQTTKVPFLCRYEGVVHNLTPLHTHVGLTYNYLALLPSVIYRNFFSQSCSLSEKCNSMWHFHFPYILQEK